MTWIAGLIAIIAFAWLMVVNERFRRFGFGIIALIIGGIAIIWFMTERSNRQYQAERERALSAVSSSQLIFSELELSEDRYGWRITGRVINASPHPLRTLTLRVYLQDCPTRANREGCITVGQDNVRFNVEVPSRQARLLTSTVRFENAAPIGSSWQWSYKVAEIQADLN